MSHAIISGVEWSLDLKWGCRISRRVSDMNLEKCYIKNLILKLKFHCKNKKNENSQMD